MAKAEKKSTTARRIAETAGRVVRYNDPDDWKALQEANASLMEAHDGDRRRLESRQQDNLLTVEEREFLAAPAAPRRRGRPEYPSTQLKRDLARKILIEAIAARAQWKPGYTVENLIADVQAHCRLNRSYAHQVYKEAEAVVRFREAVVKLRGMTDEELAAAKLNSAALPPPEAAALEQELGRRQSPAGGGTSKPASTTTI